MADEIKEVKVETSKKAEAKRAVRRSLENKVVGVDTPMENVLKWSQEGRGLYFGEDEDFLELTEEVVRSLTGKNRERYDMAKNVTLGRDVLGAIEDGRRGWEKDYAVMPGAASTRTLVTGQKQGREYYFARKDAVAFHQGEGYVVTRDPDVRVGGKDESCSYKTVGGQASPELILMERDKELGEKKKADRRELRRRVIQGTSESYKENAARIGSKASIETSTTVEFA